MIINLLRPNWFIYETDIVALGGTVLYTGNIIVKSRRSSVKEAIITLAGTNITVYMECFRDGSSVLCNFLENGKPVAKNPSEAEYFLNCYKSLRSKNDIFLEFVFFRTAKQVGIFLLQIICIVAMIHSICNISVSINPLTYLIEGALALVLFFICGNFYSYIRKMRFDKYSSVLSEHNK